MIDNFDDLYDLIAEQLINEGKVVKDLKSLNFDDIVSDMVGIERSNFQQGLQASAYALKRDWNLGGFIGIAIMDEETNKLGGYIYGYTMGEDGEYDNFHQIDRESPEFKIYDDSIRNLDSFEDFAQVFSPQKTIYVSNMAAMPDFRFGVFELIKQFIAKCRGNGYQYIIFDGLRDTMKLFLNDNAGSKYYREMKSGRLGRAGIDIMATYYEGDSMITIAKI